MNKLPISRIFFIVWAWFLLVTQPPAGPETARAGSNSQQNPPRPISTPSAFLGPTLRFVPNAGQANPAIRFQTRLSAGTLFVTPHELMFSAPLPDANAGFPQVEPTARTTDPAPATRILRIDFPGANPAPAIVGDSPLPGSANFLIGNDPAQWITGLPTFSSIRYRDIYPGIDLHLDGTSGQLITRFTVAPGADPGQIRWRYNDAISLQIDPISGNLILEWEDQDPATTLAVPQAWQPTAELPAPRAVRFVLLDERTVGLQLEDHDPAQPLTVEVPLIYATYLGGLGDDVGKEIAVDPAGHAYIIGQTQSADFPTQNPLQPDRRGSQDVFVTKLDPSTGTILYTTYLGGSDLDAGEGIVADADGNAYLTGFTTSVDFPTYNAVQALLGGARDAFVVKLDPTGQALRYATYLGGSGEEFGDGIAVDVAGQVYVTGWTASADFPTANALQPAFAGNKDTYVALLDATGTSLIYATFLGGRGADLGNDIAIDTAGQAYVTGWTNSSDFPTENAFQPQLAGADDAFVAKISRDGSELGYATFLGGSQADGGCDIAVDIAGNAFVVGDTASEDFPVLNAAQPTYGGGDWDTFVSKVDATGAALAYSTFLGGSNNDFGYGMAVDAAGYAYLTGESRSGNFPLQNPIQAHYQGNWDATIVRIEPAGNALAFSTYLGGQHVEFAFGLAIDPTGNILITGETRSADLPIENPWQPALGGGKDAFVAVVRPPTISYLPLMLR